METKSTLDRLTSLGEEVIGKASQNPNVARVVGAATQLKDRVDDLSKRVDVDAPVQLPIELEGEQVGTTPATFEIAPGALRVRVPPSS